MEAGRVSQKRRFPKAMLLENSQVNLQHGRCKLAHSFLFGTTGIRAGYPIPCGTLSIAYTATDGGCSTQ